MVYSNRYLYEDEPLRYFPKKSFSRVNKFLFIKLALEKNDSSVVTIDKITAYAAIDMSHKKFCA
jgi:hypothetical protein